MKVSAEEAELFFNLLWPLQFFVNQRLQLFPDLETLDDFKASPIERRLEIRNAVYENAELIDAFIQENPAHLSADHLAIVAEWKRFAAGDFYIERFLKKYAVFIGSDDRVYAVLGLYDAFDDMFHPRELPRYIKTVLLPFQGKIVYDGLMQGYNMFFGRGISSRLKETYMAAKQNDRIIESLSPQPAKAKAKAKRKAAKDWRAEIEELAAKAKPLRAGADQPAVVRPAFSLVKASVELAQLAVSNPDDTDSLWKALRKINRAAGQLDTTLHRADWYA
ncbi:MAG: hypothetical protein OEU26_35965 [Candidatus Tectomicrobia bacterium]|nr:hypothetical protein [Candidatus Tectomicrobia bacterium]